MRIKFGVLCAVMTCLASVALADEPEAQSSPSGAVSEVDETNGEETSQASEATESNKGDDKTDDKAGKSKRRCKYRKTTGSRLGGGKSC